MLNLSGIRKRVKNRENLLKVAVFFVSVGISVLIFIYRDNFRGFGKLGYFGIFLLSIVGNSTIIIPAPTFLTAFIGGGILNPFAVGFVSAVGASLGELTGYFAGFGGKVFIKQEKIYKKIEFFMSKNGFLTIFVLAVIPNPFFDLAGICSGLAGYPLKKFLLATILGKSVKFISFSLLGAKTSQNL